MRENLRATWTYNDDDDNDDDDAYGVNSIQMVFPVNVTFPEIHHFQIYIGKGQSPKLITFSAILTKHLFDKD